MTARKPRARLAWLERTTDLASMLSNMAAVSSCARASAGVRATRPRARHLLIHVRGRGGSAFSYIISTDRGVRPKRPAQHFGRSSWIWVQRKRDHSSCLSSTWFPLRSVFLSLNSRGTLVDGYDKASPGGALSRRSCLPSQQIARDHAQLPARERRDPSAHEPPSEWRSGRRCRPPKF